MADPLEVLSMGAGVQTTALFLMALDGALGAERLHHVIFADTRRESPGTYRNLAMLQARAAAAGVPFHVVSEGDIRADTLAHNMASRHRQFASLPLFVRNAAGKRGRLRRQCTQTYKIEPV